MSRNRPQMGEAPSNFYLRNPLALLVSKESLLDASDGDLYITRLKSANGSAPTSPGEGQRNSNQNEPFSAFLPEQSVSKRLIFELSTLIDAHQKPKDGESLNEAGNRTSSVLAPSPLSRKTAPYQILYSNTFQCYTSLAFYGALLTQLRTWIKALDAGFSSKRNLVWSHLFVMIDSDKTSSEPLSPVLHSIISQPKMSLLDIELLYLSVLLAAKLDPHLLTPSAVSSPLIAPSSSSPTQLSNSTALSDPTHSSQASKPDPSLNPSSPSSEALSQSNPSESSNCTSPGDSNPKSAISPKPDTETRNAPEKSNVSLPRPLGNSEPTDAFSKEAVMANASGFYQYYRKRVLQLHEELISSVTNQRRQALASVAPQLLSAGSPTLAPTKEDVILALALRQLATLSVWIQKVETLSPTLVDLLSAAVQTVPALRDALAESSAKTGNASMTSGLTSLLAKWTGLPQRHILTISALYNAIMMLRDFGHYDSKTFMIVKFENAELNASSSSASGTPSAAATPPTTTSPLTTMSGTSTSPGLTAGGLTAAQLSALISASSGGLGPAALSGLPPNFMGAPGSNVTSWGTSPLPPWSPVPSPLTTFAGPYNSLSPVTFVARASPLTSVTTPSVSMANANAHTGLFSNSAPTSGAILPTPRLSGRSTLGSPPKIAASLLNSHQSTPTPPSPATTSLATGLISTPMPSTGISSAFLGGRSAFGALKRAAEEEAENDLPIKRPKLTEI